MITIESCNSVFNDKTNLGSVCDVIANNKSLAPEVQAALIEYEIKLKNLLLDAQVQLANNTAYQKESIQRAKKAIESGDINQIVDVLNFAEKNFKQREIDKLLQEEAQLKQRKQSLGL